LWTTSKNRGLSVKFWDFPKILELFLYWKLCGLGAWVIYCDLVSVHHGLAEAMMTSFIGDKHVSNLGGCDLATGVREVKEGRVVCYHRCHCAEGWWVLTGSEREWWQRVELRWCGASAREDSNGDAVEWWGEWLRSEWPFYSKGGWESNGPRWVADDNSVDSMFQFWLERGGNGSKHCWKMKRRRRALLTSMGRKRVMKWRCGNVG
jgi:hypothetical protein